MLSLDLRGLLVEEGETMSREIELLHWLRGALALNRNCISIDLLLGRILAFFTSFTN